jgi:putative ABC transport system substrate-binding protein
MKRREFLRALAGAVAAPPFAARAQGSPVIGFLHAGSPEENEKRLAAFRKGLAAGSCRASIVPAAMRPGSRR